MSNFNRGALLYCMFGTIAALASAQDPQCPANWTMVDTTSPLVVNLTYVSLLSTPPHGGYTRTTSTIGLRLVTVSERTSENRSYVQDAFGLWLADASSSAPNISCDGSTTNSFDFTIGSACKKSDKYEMLVLANFDCNYNDTPYILPNIASNNSILNDTVILDAQVMVSGPNATTDANATVVFVNVLEAYEDYPYA